VQNILKHKVMDDINTIKKQLADAKSLLAESKIFLNNVPNKKYGENYALCAKIDKFNCINEKTFYAADM
jgi:hypothetical protein